MIKITFKGEELELIKSTFSSNGALYIGLFNTEGEYYADITTELEPINYFTGYPSGLSVGNKGLYTGELTKLLIEAGVIKKEEMQVYIEGGFSVSEIYPFHRLDEMSSM